VRLDNQNFCASGLEVPNVVVGETPVEWEPLGKLTLYVLELFASNAK
jgi:hypothetical protein